MWIGKGGQGNKIFHSNSVAIKDKIISNKVDWEALPEIVEDVDYLENDLWKRQS